MYTIIFPQLLQLITFKYTKKKWLSSYYDNMLTTRSKILYLAIYFLKYIVSDILWFVYIQLPPRLNN